MILTHENARWADGPKLCAWLDEKNIRPHHFGAFGRRATDWRRGSAADFFTVDRLLIAAGLHPSDVPQDVWREMPVTFRRPPRTKRRAEAGPNKHAAKLTAKDALEIRSEVRGGATRKGLARRYGVTPKTISNVVNGATWRAAA